MLLDVCNIYVRMMVCLRFVIFLSKNDVLKLHVFDVIIYMF